MQIRIASREDLGFIEGTYAHARAFMQANGNGAQWPDGYPSHIDAEEDIAHGHCFVVTDDEGLLAVFTLAPGPDETYADIKGAWRSNADYYVIHRVAAVRGRGACQFFCVWGLEVGGDSVGVGGGELGEGLFPVGGGASLDEACGGCSFVGGFAGVCEALGGSFVFDVADG